MSESTSGDLGEAPPSSVCGTANIARNTSHLQGKCFNMYVLIKGNHSVVFLLVGTSF